MLYSVLLIDADDQIKNPIILLTVGIHFYDDPPPSSVVVVNTNHLGVVCSFRGLPAPDVTWSGDNIDEFVANTTSQLEDKDSRVSEYVTTSVLDWLSADVLSRRGLSGDATCTGSNSHDSKGHTVQVEVQCKLLTCTVSTRYSINTIVFH